MSKARSWFDEAFAIADPVDRSQAMCDLAFDAREMAATGQREEAIELLNLLDTLDCYDDLLPAIEDAEEQLYDLGLRTLPPLDAVVRDLHTRFQNVGEHQRLLSGRQDTNSRAFAAPT